MKPDPILQKAIRALPEPKMDLAPLVLQRIEETPWTITLLLQGIFLILVASFGALWWSALLPDLKVTLDFPPPPSIQPPSFVGFSWILESIRAFLQTFSFAAFEVSLPVSGTALLGILFLMLNWLVQSRNTANMEV